MKSSGKVKGYSDETMTLCFCVLLQFILISLKVNNANNLSPSYLYVLHGSDLMISSMRTVQCILIQKTKCIIQKEYFQSSETWGHKLAPWIFDVGVGLSILSVQYL